ncbi:MAG: DNA adenine methylase [Bacteroidia bacterium]|nr:DNA adenine methylase [Bacteroidia bacterium]
MKTPITYYGGKQTMAKLLLNYIPTHRLYCEPFFGGGALFFSKAKSEVEVINDINGEVINFYRVVQTKFLELETEIKTTLHSRELFKNAKIVYENPQLFTDVKRAWAFWTMANQSYASSLESWGYANDNAKEKTLANKRESFSLEYAIRLELVQIESNDALKVIDRCDTVDAFFYLDPPYCDSHQGHYKGYSNYEFMLLLERLSTIKGKFLLSSYPSELLKNYIEKFNWNSESFNKPVGVTKNTKKLKTEVLTFNYDRSMIPEINSSLQSKIFNNQNNN